MIWLNKVHFGDCLETLRQMPDGIVNTCVTSPPYFGLRSYLPDGHDDKPLEIGTEETPDEFIANLVAVFREVRRVLRDDGTLWVNIGDSYAAQRGGSTPPAETLAGGIGGKGDDDAKRGRKDGYNPARNASAIGLKHKDLIGIPWMLAFALRADGWYLRQEIIWAKPNPMPESVTDRCTKSHEQIFLLAKSPKYYFDAESISEPFAHPEMQAEARRRKDAGELRSGRYMDMSGRNDAASYSGGVGFAGRETRNKRSVWTVSTKPYSGAHFATFPPDLIEPCILAGAPAGGVVLDPFMGSGTTAQVAQNLGRQWIGCELNSAYATLQNERTAQMGLMLDVA